MRLVYIAGPFRAEDGRELADNIATAEDAIGVIAERSLFTAIGVCVHSMFASYDRTYTDRFWLDATAAIMGRCDALYLLPGWEESEGSRAELEDAKALGMPIFYSLTDLTAYLRDHGPGSCPGCGDLLAPGNFCPRCNCDCADCAIAREG